MRAGTGGVSPLSPGQETPHGVTGMPQPVLTPLVSTNADFGDSASALVPCLRVMKHPDGTP